MKKSNFAQLLATAFLGLALPMQAIVLVQTNAPGYYNNSVGTVLNGTNGGEGGMFPVYDDSTLSFPSAPDLSAASAALGNWLTNPLSLNSNWQALNSIPNSWTPGDEVAVMYQFNTLGATNVLAKFAVDNGIFAWIDGTYLGGARAGGGPAQWEYQFNVGNLNAGTHFLQLLLEDHGGSNGYGVEITADAYTPGPPPSVPETGSILTFALGFAFLAGVRRIMRR